MDGPIRHRSSGMQNQVGVLQRLIWEGRFWATWVVQPQKRRRATHVGPLVDWFRIGHFVPGLPKPRKPEVGTMIVDLIG